MNKINILWVSTILLLVLFPISVYAHPGKTDSAGGHYDRQSGGYHYHHGYPAHSHTNGVCPYNYDDKTDHRPNNNSNNSDRNKGTSTTSKNAKTKTPTWKHVVGTVFAAIICSPLFFSFFFFVYYRIIQPIIKYVKKKKQ